MGGLRSRVARRRLLGGAAGAAALSALSWSRVLGANERVRIASIGVGGKGWSDLTATAASPHADVVALCDIDESADFLGRAAERFPQAARHTDWRRLLDAAGTFDAVIVSTPDHMHAPVALPAMQLGKHVQCQKPLTHTVFEARQMAVAARRNRVVTQMGNQIQSHEAYRTAVKGVHDGVIGRVKEVHSWQSGALGWMLVDARPTGAAAVPAGVHWDGWLGVAPERPYQERIYHPFNWRAWHDFSNGQLGDFGCHILDPVFMALCLSSPATVRAEAAADDGGELWYRRSRVTWEFPGTPHTAGPTVSVTWYDGEGHLPAAEATGVPAVDLPKAGSALVGERGTLLVPHVAMPRLFPAEAFADRGLEPVAARNHYVSWVDACRGADTTTSSFDFSGPLTETVLLGTIAIRLPGRALAWNAERLELTGDAAAQPFVSKPYRKGWEPTWG
jgi:predicted dehydrogenase